MEITQEMLVTIAKKFTAAVMSGMNLKNKDSRKMAEIQIEDEDERIRYAQKINAICAEYKIDSQEGVPTKDERIEAAEAFARVSLKIFEEKEVCKFLPDLKTTLPAGANPKEVPDAFRKEGATAMAYLYGSVI